MSEVTIRHDQLILDGEYKTALLTLKKGAGELGAGTILSKVVAFKATGKAGKGDKQGTANVGNGTLVVDATTPLLAGHQLGVYTLVCTAAAAAGPPTADAQFSFIAPDGTDLGPIEAATTPGTTVANQLKFVIMDGQPLGSTPFAVDDEFTITVAEDASKGHGLLEEWDKDSGNAPHSLLMHDAANVANATQNVTVYLAGTFNAELIEDADDAFEGLRKVGIYLKHSADEGKYPLPQD